MSFILSTFYVLVAFGVLISIDGGKTKHPILGIFVALMWPILVGSLIGRQFKDDTMATAERQEP